MAPFPPCWLPSIGREKVGSGAVLCDAQPAPCAPPPPSPWQAGAQPVFMKLKAVGYTVRLKYWQTEAAYGNLLPVICYGEVTLYPSLSP